MSVFALSLQIEIIRELDESLNHEIIDLMMSHVLIQIEVLLSTEINTGDSSMRFN